MVIIFGKNDKVENIGILAVSEARAYVCFLLEEKKRHEGDIEDAQTSIDAKGFWPDKSKVYDRALELLWRSALCRHRKDIEEIDILISTVKGFYGI